MPEKKVTTTVEDVATTPVEAAVDAAEAAADAATDAAEAVADAAEQAADDAKAIAEADRFSALERQIADIASRPVDAVGEHTHPEIDSALQAIQADIGKLSEASAKVADAAVDAVEGASETVTDPVKEAVDTVTEPIADAVPDVAPKRSHWLFRPLFGGKS